MRPPQSQDEEGQDVGDAEDGGIGGRDGDGEIDPDNPSDNPPPGPGDVPEDGPGEDRSSRKISSLSSRLLPINGVFDVVLRSPEEARGLLKLVEVGADGKELPLDFDTAKNEVGEEVEFCNGVSSQPFEFGLTPIRITLGMSSFLERQ